ncbi:T9SS type A sorting domain-containing protein [Winogradskyella bathintestinalis]
MSNVLGKIVMQGYIDSNVSTRVNGLTNGLYFLNINNQQTFKFIKN